MKDSLEEKPICESGGDNATQNDIDARLRSAIIDQTFLDLGIGARVDNYVIGPSVTRFNIRSGPRVKARDIMEAEDDLQKRLGVLIRFEEEVPTSPFLGLEVPNNRRSITSFRETFAALPSGPKDNLVIPFGESIDGKIAYGDLTRFPHLLVSGASGSGKSIYIHSLITSLIMRNDPEDLKLLLIDTKRTEMGRYREIPHLLCPPIKEPTEAKAALDKLLDEMERRYSLLESSGVGSIRDFNADVVRVTHCKKMPFIVCVIDEYADLIDACKDISNPVISLAQKSRAAGIHLVISTAHPDEKIINDNLRANIPAKAAFSADSLADSVQFLGEGGAEKLLGCGDMLLRCMSLQRSGLMRLQGCYISNGEIRAFADKLRAENKPAYDQNFLDLKERGAEPTGEGECKVPSFAELRAAEDEEKYKKVRQAILTREYTSISSIQREFGLGFPRAGKIFARLQKEGIIAKEKESDSLSKGCRVLVHELPESLVEESENS